MTPEHLDTLKNMATEAHAIADDERHSDEVRANARQRAEAIDAAVATLEKLPVTTDGKIVLHPTAVYWNDGNVTLKGAAGLIRELVFVDLNDPEMSFSPNCGIEGCYSTEAAALAAKE